MRTALFLAALVAGSSAAAAQVPVKLDAKSKAELLATREQAWRAWFAGDRKTLEAMLPAEFIGIGWNDGPFDDRNAALGASAEFASGGGKLTLLEFPKTEIQVYGEAAFVYSTYKVEYTSGGKEVEQEGRATEVFVRRGGKWLHPGWHLDSVK
jgi:hypothetical protein